MKVFIKLTIANIKMFFRDRQSIIWSLLFPLILIGIFGILDFAKFSTAKVGLVYDDSTKVYATSIKETLINIGDYYKIQEGTLDDEKKALTNDDRIMVLEFKTNEQTKKLDINAYLNKGNEQTAQATFLIIQKIFADYELKMSKIEPLFNITSEVINVHNLRNVDYLVPGIIAMSLMQGGLLGVIGTIVSYREKGILKRLFATPLSKSNFLLSQIISRLLISILQVSILLISSYLIFQIKIVGNIFLVALVGILGSLTFLAFGFTISGIAKTSESARAILMPVQMIMMFTSGVYFSRDVLPTWLFKITAYEPLTYLADSLRYIMTRGYTLNDKVIYTAVISLFIWLVILVVVSVKTFKWEKN